MNNPFADPYSPRPLDAVPCSTSLATPETDAAFGPIYKPPYRVGLSGLAKLIMFVRDLERDRNHNRVCIERLEAERLLLAKLAAKEPQFFNPLEAMDAQRLRDRILAENIQAHPRKRHVRGPETTQD